MIFMYLYYIITEIKSFLSVKRLKIYICILTKHVSVALYHNFNNLIHLKNISVLIKILTHQNINKNRIHKLRIKILLVEI